MPEIIILVPALLGLKGNLEMTLASRLSTESNMGHMDTHKQKLNLIVGNMALIQVITIIIIYTVQLRFILKLLMNVLVSSHSCGIFVFAGGNSDGADGEAGVQLGSHTGALLMQHLHSVTRQSCTR